MALFEKLYEDSILPKRGTLKSAGYDLYAHEEGIVKAHGRLLIKVGITVQLADRQYLQIVPRSGLAIKYGITVLNTPGTIDADYYPNEIGVILYNTSDEDFQVKQGDRIAQSILSHYEIMAIDNVDERERTSGFGSTGKE